MLEIASQPVGSKEGGDLVENEVCHIFIPYKNDSLLSTLKVLVATIDAQWEGMGGCRVGEV